MTSTCDRLVDAIVSGLDVGSPGTVRRAVESHCDQCEPCAERRGVLAELAAGLDPQVPDPSVGFVARVMAEVRGETTAPSGAYDRLPPAWQVVGASALLVALTAIVLATGGSAEWRGQVVTGFLDEALVFLGGLSQTITGLWESVAPGQGLPVFISCAVAATILNVAFAVAALRRRKETADS